MRNHSVVHRISGWVVLLMLGCASSSAPEKWLPVPEDLPTNQYGGWLELRMTDGELKGELIAVGPDTVYIASPSLVAVPVSAVSYARLQVYDDQHSHYTGYILLGSVASIPLNGLASIVSVPVWLIGGIIASSVRSNEPMIESPPEPLQSFSLYARYPQGLPEGIDRGAIVRR